MGATDIAYVAPAAPDTADCSETTPCSLSHGVSLGRSYTVIAAGTYQLTTTLAVVGDRWLIGAGTQPTMTRTTPGPIVSIGAGATVRLENVRLTGATATSSSSFDGVGIECANDTQPRTLEMTDVVVTANAGIGVDANTCAVTATRSSFTHNGTTASDHGVYIKDHTGTFDRCEFSDNHGDGLNFDGTVLSLTNSFLARNFGNGIVFSAFGAGSKMQFCTLTQNVKMGASIQQNPSTETFDATNNLIAGNAGTAFGCFSSNCVTGGSIQLGTDATTVHFASTTDFHIMPGSVAIDAAVGGMLDHDYDGDVRPKGAARDVGADEAQ